jgi:hypothetical protein
MIGGHDRQYYRTSVEIFTGGAWSLFEHPLPSVILYPCLATVEESTMPLVIGGTVSEDSSDVLFFDDGSKAWRLHSNLNRPTYFHSCGLVPTDAGGKKKSVIVAGGTGMSVEILDQEWIL